MAGVESALLIDISTITRIFDDGFVGLDINRTCAKTGVNNSPTLIKREVKTSLSIADGDVVVLGGLTENKDAGGGAGFSFLPKWTKSKNSNTNKSEILLALQLNKF